MLFFISVRDVVGLGQEEWVVGTVWKGHPRVSGLLSITVPP